MSIIFTELIPNKYKCVITYKGKQYIGYGSSTNKETAQFIALSNAYIDIPENFRQDI